MGGGEVMNATHEKHRQALIEEIRDIKRQLNDYPEDLSDVLHRTLNALWGVLDPETMEPRVRKDDNCMTLRQFIEELNQVPEEHKDKKMLSITNTTAQGFQYILMRPNSRLTLDFTDDLITLGLVQLPKEDTK